MELDNFDTGENTGENLWVTQTKFTCFKDTDHIAHPARHTPIKIYGLEIWFPPFLQVPGRGSEWAQPIEDTADLGGAHL